MECPSRNTGRPGNRALPAPAGHRGPGTAQSQLPLGPKYSRGRPRRHGETVPQVVVARHGKAPLRQVGRQGLIPQDVLRHAMGEHQNRPGCHVRRPLHRMDAGSAVAEGR